MALKMKQVLALLPMLIVAASTVQARDPVHANPPAGYRLVWSDDFDKPGLPNEKAWVYDTEGNRTGWYNNEKQYYAVRRLENSKIENGKLIITAHKEKLISAPDYGGQNYSSARLITRGRASWTYGYFEIKARLPCGRGTWPAFWMLGPDEIPWPDNGEIDIMEQVGKEPSKITGTIHAAATAGTFGDGGETTLGDACDTFHIYHMIWTQDKIAIGVDGKVFHTYENDGKGDVSWPFDTPHYLLINLAIGGDMAGDVDDRIFPARLAIDSIKVYQREK